MAELVSGNELAKRLGVSETSVRKHVARGLYKPNRSGKFDVEQCRAAWQALRDPVAVANGTLSQTKGERGQIPAGTIPENSFLKVRTAQAAVKAQLGQLQLQKARNEVIDRRDAQRAVLAVVREIIQRLDGLPSAAAPVVHAAPSVAEAEALLRGMVRAVRVEVAKLGETFDDEQLRSPAN